jgi:hypothetical protein
VKIALGSGAIFLILNSYGPKLAEVSLQKPAMQEAT